jgi:hypothetical protein
MLVVCKFKLGGINGVERVSDTLLVFFSGDMSSNVEGKGTGFIELLKTGVLVFW